MSAIASELDEASVLDLFSGSGALGIEALSRGAAHVTFVESAPRAIAVLRENLASLGASEDTFEIVRGDAMRFVEKLEPRSFDLALADPPYRQGLAAGLADAFAARPFASVLCIEHAPDESLRGAPSWHRRYGDTALTFFRTHDD